MEKHKDNLIYIKGFLDGISYMNTFDSDVKTYTVEIVQKVNSDFQDTIRSRFKTKNWIVSTERITENWRAVLKKDLRPYFDQIIVEVFCKTNRTTLFDLRGNYKEGAIEAIEKLRVDNNFYIDHLLLDKFLDSLEPIVGKEPQLYRVEIDWHPMGKEYE